MASEARTSNETGATTNIAFGVAERSRQVWIVLTACLLAFVALCTMSIFGVTSFVSGFTVAQSAHLEPYAGSNMILIRHGTVEEVKVSTPIQLQEGDSVKTEGTGSTGDRGLVRLFDESTVNLSFNSQITLDTLRTNDFGRSLDVRFTLNRGSLQVNRGQQQADTNTHYVVATELAEVEISAGSKVRFNIEEIEDRTIQVEVVSGSARFRSKGETILLGPSQMAWVSYRNVPQGPLVAETNLIANGNFVDGPTTSSEYIEEGGLGIAGWYPIRDEGSIPVPRGSITITSELDRPVARIQYEANPNQYARVGMSQQIQKSTEFYSTIELSATVKLVRQQDSGRGALNDLYPLTIRVYYSDSDGDPHRWEVSFYYGDEDEVLTDTFKVKLPVGKWETTDEIREIRVAAAQGNADLAQINAQLFKLPPQDVYYVQSMEVFGSGTSFESWITNISLLAR